MNRSKTIVLFNNNNQTKPKITLADVKFDDDDNNNNMELGTFFSPSMTTAAAGLAIDHSLMIMMKTLIKPTYTWK